MVRLCKTLVLVTVLLFGLFLPKQARGQSYAGSSYTDSILVPHEVDLFDPLRAQISQALFFGGIGIYVGGTAYQAYLGSQASNKVLLGQDYTIKRWQKSIKYVGLGLMVSGLLVNVEFKHHEPVYELSFAATEVKFKYRF